MRRAIAALGVLAAASAALPAAALPAIAVDTQPGSSGVQPTHRVLAGELFEISIWISNVQGPGLGAFAFDLGVDPSLLSIESVEVGAFVPPPIFEVENRISDSRGLAHLEATNLGDAGETGDGVLARARLRAMADGTTRIALANVVLSRPHGVAITGFATQEARVRVPEPGWPALVTGAGCGLAFLRRARRGRQPRRPSRSGRSLP